MKKLGLAILTSSLVLVGCSSSTMTSTTGVDRKQLLLVSDSEINALSAQNYQETLAVARRAGVLNTNPAQRARLQRITNRLIPQARVLRPESANWAWEVNVIQDNELNAMCAPGGKILFYSGLIDRLRLTDDEIAAIMGHEMAHALRDHGRENVSRAYAQQAGLSILSSVAGLSQGQTQLAGLVGELGVSLPNSRTQEREADVLGLELMARGGYNPNAAVTLWQKMMAAETTRSPQFLSTHPSSGNRVQSIQALIPTVMPLYQQAIGRR
ncbi:M48 family metallopeptidase [Acinetobacter sp. c3-l95]|uniref:M48 family metallopeptidase n=1 Tax=Acinetobacter sp. c3-l95 TaxID=3342804 RepID=UPI0035B9D035